jgi:hypothetical protein
MTSLRHGSQTHVKPAPGVSLLDPVELARDSIVIALHWKFQQSNESLTTINDEEPGLRIKTPRHGPEEAPIKPSELGSHS